MPIADVPNLPKLFHFDRFEQALHVFREPFRAGTSIVSALSFSLASVDVALPRVGVESRVVVKIVGLVGDIL